ncbi:MAG: DUF3093 family protein [Acidobacteria bacterium]|nr:DUF3093 family protein [Acidobacteriota bacterium]
MTRYSPSRHYVPAGWIALGLTAFSAWCASQWLLASIAAGLFLASAGALFFLSFRPTIEIRDTRLVVGKRSIPWNEIRRVDRTGWVSPLIVHLTLADARRLTLIYPGDLDSAGSLLRQLQRGAREALLDGVPHRRFWRHTGPGAGAREAAKARYPLLRPEDEVEVERLYQRLKTVGRLDRKDSGEEK